MTARVYVNLPEGNCWLHLMLSFGDGPLSSQVLAGPACRWLDQQEPLVSDNGPWGSKYLTKKKSCSEMKPGECVCVYTYIYIYIIFILSSVATQSKVCSHMFLRLYPFFYPFSELSAVCVLENLVIELLALTTGWREFNLEISKDIPACSPFSPATSIQYQPAE